MASPILSDVSRVRVADVALDPRSGGADAVYTYRAEATTQIGDACFVPIGTRPSLGFVTDVYEATEAELGFGFDALKSLLGKVDNLDLPHAIVDLAKFVAAEYLCPLPVALTAATPPGVRERIVTAWSLVEAPSPEFTLTQDDPKLTPVQQEILRTLQDLGGILAETATKKIPPPTLKALKALQAKGLVEQRLRIQPYAERRKGKDYLALTADTAQLEHFLTHEGKRKPAQALTLMRLQGAEHAYLTPMEIKALAGVTETTIKALVDSGLLVPTDPDDIRLSKPPKPNPYQQLAIDAVSDAIQAREPHPYLLFGVTGSGKTEVYLRLTAEALKQGRQVLYLVPEIALATQSIAQLRERFGKGVAILHSELPPRERLQNWLRIREGEISIVLGARSALFAPLANLGLIIVDEEHEASYKQESAPRYHTKRLARFLSQRHGCPLVLGSATPSIESFYEAEQEGLTLLSLPERAASATLPSVFIDNLADGYKSGRPSILAEDLQDRLTQTLERQEQTILFLNRRAYAPFIICRDCGHQMLCPRCSVSLSYHRRDVMLRCHHCGFQVRPPDTCPKCQGLRMNPFGVGTEKVEEAVKELFPAARISRLDRDVARKKGALESILADFRSGDLDILVGTQMVAKGLDFPNVTLVGVIAADVSLNIPDFRASERTFQLLSQVAGRAGRGKRPGQVVIQTFNPDHVAVATAQTHNFLAFYESLKVEREQAGYPPFRRLVNVVLSGESRSAVVTASDEVRQRIEALEKPYEILGPADCPLERLHNRWRRHVLVKMPAGESSQAIGEALLGFRPTKILVVIDVDPYSLM